MELRMQGVIIIEDKGGWEGRERGGMGERGFVNQQPFKSFI